MAIKITLEETTLEEWLVRIEDAVRSAGAATDGGRSIMLEGLLDQIVELIEAMEALRASGEIEDAEISEFRGEAYEYRDVITEQIRELPHAKLREK